MNVATISMPRQLARQKLKEYRSKVHRQADGEYEAAAKGYEALAEGTPLIDIASVFHDCPMDTNGYPRLAICRADRKEVMFRMGSNSFTGNFIGGANSEAERSPTLNLQVRFAFERKKYVRIFAPVPMIPADVIPAKGQRRQWHILWEVDHWATRSMFAPPSRDPYLLKHIGGTLYAVLAEWDLTDLERAVMSGALGS